MHRFHWDVGGMGPGAQPRNQTADSCKLGAAHGETGQGPHIPPRAAGSGVTSLCVTQLALSTGQVALIVLLTSSHAAEEIALISNGLQEIGLHQADIIQL